MVNLGSFLNEFVANSSVFWPLMVGAVIAMPVFAYFYNRLMDSLGKHEHTSLYVAGGVLVTIATAALFSWKAALLFLVLFILNGIPMIVGDFLRSKRKAAHHDQKSPPRRKRLPYAANALIDEASMAGEEASKYLTAALKKRHNNNEEMLAMLMLAGQELAGLRLKLAAIKGIQVSEK